MELLALVVLEAEAPEATLSVSVEPLERQILAAAVVATVAQPTAALAAAVS